MSTLKIRLTRTAVLAATLAASSAHASPWALGQGRFYGLLEYAHLSSNQLATPDGTIFEIPHFTKDDVIVVLAYGLSSRFTVMANVPALRSSNLADEPNELDRESGFGDLGVGVQAQLGEAGAWSFSLRAIAQLPTGDETRAQGLLPTGSGVYENELALFAGRAFGGGRGFVAFEVGNQFRQQLQDGIVYGMRVGWNVSKHFSLSAGMRGVEPYSHQAPEQARGSFVGVGDRVTYIAYGPTASLSLGGGLRLNADFAGHTRARALARGWTTRASLSYSR